MSDLTEPPAVGSARGPEGGGPEERARPHDGDAGLPERAEVEAALERNAVTTERLHAEPAVTDRETD